MYDEAKGRPFSEASTENHTKFHFEDAMVEVGDTFINDLPWERREQWRRFHGYQNGIWNWGWADKSILFPQDNDAIFDAIAGQIGITRTQKECGRDLFREIHFPTHSPYYTVIDIAFYICVLVCNEDYRGKGWVFSPDKKNYHQPTGDDHVRDAQIAFIELAEKLDLDNPEGKLKKGLHRFDSVIKGLS